jgi:hypothetical protein
VAKESLGQSRACSRMTIHKDQLQLVPLWIHPSNIRSSNYLQQGRTAHSFVLVGSHGTYFRH